jgi:asparagine synthase (glutamine-hydrolysing)
MRWDLTHTLPFDLLRRIDRASMGCAVEVRCPMLDTRVCELASHLPPNVLLPHNRPKGLLRQLAKQLLPKEIAQRPKHDVSIPMGTWFTEHLRQPLADRILDGHLGVHGIDRSAVEKLFDQHMRHETDHTHKLFALLSLSIWTDWFQS